MTSTAVCATCGSSTSEPRFNAASSGAIEELRLNGSIAPDEVQRTLSLLEREYQDYSLRISQLQGQIRVLMLHQRRVKEYQSNLRTFQSPIRKVPNEILRWIFNYASSNNILLEDDCNIRLSTVHEEYTPGVIPALALSSVCSQWRNLASSYPEIWSRITLLLKLKVPPGAASKGFMDTVEVFIERSGSFPLSLRIESLQLGVEVNAFHPVLSLVGKHTQRWSAFEFLSQRVIEHEMFGLPSHVVTFPILENLKIIRPSDVGFFQHAPKLSSLSTNTALPLALNPTHHWQQLTSLEIRNTRRLRELVRISSKLVSINIHLPGIPLLPLESELLIMENLKWLMIIFDGAFYTNDSGTYNLEMLLSSLLCSALTSLCITKNSSAAEIRWPRNTLTSFLARSSCSITELLIEYMDLTDNDLISLCKSIPALISLSVRDSNNVLRTHSSIAITSTFIKSLHSFASSALRPSFQPLLPKLQQLSLTYAGDSFDDAAFVDMVESRCLPKADALRMGITPLRSVVLKYWHRSLSSLDEVKDIYKPLALLDQAGFRIVVNLKDDPSDRSQSVAVRNF
ncbi:hypothetical protein EV360DRAFT_74855 [Lentinula raphanica]|nr:hypothetical protein EV360DRAFT_74855 [Lentinula raphanica]